MPPRESKDSSAEAPGSPKRGDWRTNLRVLAGVRSRPVAGREAGPSRSPPARAAPGPSGLPPGNGGVQEFDLRRVEGAAAVFVPLGVYPHSEGVFAVRVGLPVPWPVVAFLPEVHELGEAMVPAGFILNFLRFSSYPDTRERPEL
jgi:hypothetical protein